MNTITFSAMVIMLLLASVCDIKTQIVPDIFSISLCMLGVVSAFLFDTPDVISRLLGLVIVSVPLLLVSVLTNGFGGADIKLFAACGFILGTKNILLAFFIAIILAAAFGLGLIAAKNQKLKTRIPFVPFISVGVIIAASFGEKLVNWYLGLF